MDGKKENEVISTAWECLLLWQVLILGGAFEQAGAGARGRGGRGSYYIMKNEQTSTFIRLHTLHGLALN